MEEDLTARERFMLEQLVVIRKTLGEIQGLQKAGRPPSIQDMEMIYKSGQQVLVGSHSGLGTPPDFIGKTKQPEARPVPSEPAAEGLQSIYKK